MTNAHPDNAVKVMARDLLSIWEKRPLSYENDKRELKKRGWTRADIKKHSSGARLLALQEWSPE